MEHNSIQNGENSRTDLMVLGGVAGVTAWSTRFGVQVGVRTHSQLMPDVVEALSLHRLSGGEIEPACVTSQSLFRFEEKRHGDGSATYKIIHPDSTESLEPNLKAGLQGLETAVEQFIAESAKEFVFVHSGVVRWKDQAILIPGRSFSGKSTLIMELVAAGATYYSDEYAVIDRKGLVHAYPRVPRLRPVREGRTCDHPVAVSNLQLDPVPAGLVVKTQFAAAAIWDPRPLTPGETLLALLDNTVAIRSQTDFAVNALGFVVSSARGFKTQRAEAVAVAGEIFRLVEGAAGANSCAEEE